jgi:hypothetical protein
MELWKKEEERKPERLRRKQAKRQLDERDKAEWEEATRCLQVLPSPPAPTTTSPDQNRALLLHIVSRVLVCIACDVFCDCGRTSNCNSVIQ